MENGLILFYSGDVMCAYIMSYHPQQSSRSIGIFLIDLKTPDKGLFI